MSDIEEEEEAPEYEEFMASLHQVHLRDTNSELNKVQAIANSNAAAVDQTASKIYLEKELKAACGSSSESAQQCKKGITNLQTCVNNAAAAQTVLSNLVVQAQLESAVKQHIFDAPTLNPQAMSVVSSSRECEDLQAQLAKVLASIARRQQNILEKRVQVAELHKRVSALWQQKHERDVTVALDTNSDELKTLRERLKGREGRTEVIAHFIETLITGSSSQWGKNAELIQVLQACEMINSRQTASLEQCQAISDLIHR